MTTTQIGISDEGHEVRGFWWDIIIIFLCKRGKLTNNKKDNKKFHSFIVQKEIPPKKGTNELKSSS